MAIRYVSLPEKGTTIAILENTTYDVVNKINKILGDSPWCFVGRNYLMPRSFKAVAKVYGGDVFDEEEGKKIAKEKLMKKYRKAYDKRMSRFAKCIDDLNNSFTKAYH